MRLVPTQAGIKQKRNEFNYARKSLNLDVFFVLDVIPDYVAIEIPFKLCLVKRGKLASGPVRRG